LLAYGCAQAVGDIVGGRMTSSRLKRHEGFVAVLGEDQPKQEHG
jgi:hypothetical protein